MHVTHNRVIVECVGHTNILSLYTLNPDSEQMPSAPEDFVRSDSDIAREMSHEWAVDPDDTLCAVEVARG